MTKRKTGIFRGSWLDETITRPKPAPDFLTIEQKKNFAQQQLASEKAAREELLAFINNHNPNIDAEGVLNVILREAALWRFNAERVAQEPEPAEWAVLIGKIKIPILPTQMEVLQLTADIRRLPGHVLAVMDGHLQQIVDCGHSDLLRCMAECPATDDVHDTDAIRSGLAVVLRDCIAAMSEDLKGLTGRRGPKLKVGPALKAVTVAIQAGSNIGKVEASELAAYLLREVGVKAPECRSKIASALNKL